MADQTFIPKQLDQILRLPESTLIGQGWLHLVYDPVAKLAYAAETKQVALAVAPQLLFGTANPPSVTTAIVGSTYTKDLQDGTAEVYQMRSAGWTKVLTLGGAITPPAPTSWTSTKGFTATCATGFTGTSVFREATRTSSVSQADADALALAAATANAMAALVCTPATVTYSSTKSFTASCQSGYTGAPVTRLATISSFLSQADADTKALAEAKRLALQDLVCTLVLTTPAAPVFLSYNVEKRQATVAAPSGYTNAQLDYRVNGGSSLSVPASGLIGAGEANVPIGSLVVYVRASSTNNQGAQANNTVAFPAEVKAITYTATRSYTATCPAGTVGSSVTRSATRSSVVSQGDAEALALEAATQAAMAVLVCTTLQGTFTPEPPLFVADDFNNLFALSHPLGNSELLLSENNGVFLPYAGQVFVGDVARPGGYWRAKTRAAVNRNESPVTLSPPFTPAGGSGGNQAPVVTSFTTSADTLISGQSLVFTAEATDADGTVSSIRVYESGVTAPVATIAGSSGSSAAITPAAGTRLYTARAVDNAGLEGAAFSSRTVTVTAAPVANQAPAVTGFTTSAASGALTAGQPLTFTAAATDADGTVASIRIYQNGVVAPVATIAGTSGTSAAITPTVGSHTYSAKAVDNAGLEGAAFGTTRTVAVAPLAFNTTLQPGQNADIVTYNGAAGTSFRFNAPLPDGDPSPAVMLLFAGANVPANQIGQVDFNGTAIGQPCAAVHNGTTYPLTFQNSDYVNLLA